MLNYFALLLFILNISLQVVSADIGYVAQLVDEKGNKIVKGSQALVYLSQKKASFFKVLATIFPGEITVTRPVKIKSKNERISYTRVANNSSLFYAKIGQVLNEEEKNEFPVMRLYPAEMDLEWHVEELGFEIHTYGLVTLHIDEILEADEKTKDLYQRIKVADFYNKFFKKDISNVFVLTRARNL